MHVMKHACDDAVLILEVRTQVTHVMGDWYRARANIGCVYIDGDHGRADIGTTASTSRTSHGIESKGVSELGVVKVFCCS